MERNGNEDRIATRIDKRPHIARHGLRQRDLARVFEPQREAPGRLAVGNGRPGARNDGRLGKASAAGLKFGGLQRHTASAAPAITEPIDVPPTGCAKGLDLRHDRSATGAARRECQVDDPLADDFDRGSKHVHAALSPRVARRTSQLVPAPLFDHRLRAMRRDRAARTGVETFLFDRAFDDCLERLAAIRGEFGEVLLAGCPNPGWPARLAPSKVSAIEPGPLMALKANARCADLESLPIDGGRFGLCITIGLLDTANNIELAAAGLNRILKPGGLLLGAIAGGNSFPRLRQAMLAADSVSGQVTPHVHPRIEAAALAQLLSHAGLNMPVVDVDLVEIRYNSLDALVSDLRAMGMTNILNARSRRPMSRAELQAARTAFSSAGERVSEQIDILHFAAWKPG